MDRFKQMAASQMYQGFAQICLVFSPIVIFLGGFLGKHLFLADLIYVVVPFLLMVLFGFYVRVMERQVQTTPAMTADLERERDAVVKSWLTKPFPDWHS